MKKNIFKKAGRVFTSLALAVSNLSDDVGFCFR